MNYFNQISRFYQIDIYAVFSTFFLFFILVVNVVNKLNKFNFFKKKFSLIRIYYFIFYILILAFLGYSLFLMRMQYEVWKMNPISKYILPPYQDISYFWGYSLFHYFRDFYFRLLGALLSLVVIFLINFSLKRDVFYDEEKILVPLLNLFFSFPYNIFFVMSGFFMLLLIIMVKIFINPQNLFRYYSFKNYWLLWATVLFMVQPLFISNYYFLQYRP